MTITDKEQEYFSDGLAEEIINALTHIPDLKVIARTSSFAFRGKEQDIRRIAEALGVTNILEGSVRKAGNRIRVTVQLVTAADGSHLWSERYDRELTDVLVIQDEISQAIADKLRVRLSGDRPMVKRPTENVEAYNLYLKGRYQLSKFTAESMTKGKKYFEQATAIDANYSLAWHGLAMYYWFLGYLGFMPPNETNERCSQATIKALKLDEMLAEAHSLMAMLQASNFDWNGAERNFRRALELDAKSADVWANYSQYYLVPMRRLDEAVAAAQQALELDPLSPHRQWQLGHRYYYLRQYHRATEQFCKTLELDPQYYLAHVHIGLDHIHTGSLDEGVRAVGRAAQFMGQRPLVLAALGFAYARAGWVSEAQKLLEELQRLAQKAYVQPIAFSTIYSGLGEIDKVFDWIEKALDARDSMVLAVCVEPLYDPLRSHPRYHALLRKMNLEP